LESKKFLKLNKFRDPFNVCIRVLKAKGTVTYKVI